MRFALFAAPAALLLSSAVQAAVTVKVSAFATGTTESGCTYAAPECAVVTVTPVSKWIEQTLTFASLPNGTAFNDPFVPSGAISGTILAGPNGAYSGINFAFIDMGASAQTYFNTRLFAQTFIVRQIDAGAVPEPATWAMMLMGFGAAGYAMRRRSSRALIPTSVRV